MRISELYRISVIRNQTETQPYYYLGATDVFTIYKKEQPIDLIYGEFYGSEDQVKQLVTFMNSTMFINQ